MLIFATIMLSSLCDMFTHVHPYHVNQVIKVTDVNLLKKLNGQVKTTESRGLIKEGFLVIILG